MEKEIIGIKLECKKKYDSCIKILEYIIGWTQHDSDEKDGIEREMLYKISILLEDIQKNIKVLKQLILKNNYNNGYYEILRANMELMSILKYILLEKNMIYKKYKAYEYFQMLDMKNLYEEKIQKSNLRLYLMYGYTEEQAKEQEEKLKEEISKQLLKINNEMEKEEYFDIKEKLKKEKKQTYHKFYKYYNESKTTLNTYGKLTYFLGEEMVYNYSYNITSQIVHGLSIRHRENIWYMLYSTIELMNSLYQLLKLHSVNLLSKDQVNTLKEWGKEEIGVNFIDN